MGWLIVIGAYLFLLVLICLFLRGGALKECTYPRSVEMDLLLFEQMQSDSAVDTEPAFSGEWGREIDLPTATSAQSNL
jgi:hypothetical protein